MAAILGLCSTEQYDAERFKNIRRSVQYFYPNGAAPLTGLLSLMDDEATNDPSFTHWEKRLATQRTLTVSQGSSKGPFKTSVDGDLGDAQTITQNTEYIVCVADATIFRVGHVIRIPVDTDSGTAYALKGVVTALTDQSGSPNKIKFRLLSATLTTDLKNGTTPENVGKEVLIVGSAFAQGVVDLSQEVYNPPAPFVNYTQIFRTPFSMTGTALKAPLKYDETGPYKDKAKEHSIMHMIEIEKAFLFGHKHLYTPSGSAAPTTGAGLPVYTTGGILYHLERYEAGDYGTVTATLDSDDDKRIITNTAGTINEKTYDGYLERVFRVTNNTASEKLVLCGSGFLQTINQLYRSKTVLYAELPFTDTYGMNVVKHTTPFGTIYYKTHPLFTQNPTLRYNALFLDVRNLKYRPMQGRDTELLKNRQSNDADYRKDEWLTEAGLELWFPESHMYLQNVRDYTP